MAFDQHSGNYYVEVLDALPVIAWASNLKGEVTFYNRKWYEYTGLNFQQTKDWGWKDIIHPDDLEYNLEIYQTILQSSEEGSFEIRERNNEGSYRFHLVRINPLKDSNGNILLWVGTATDIQELKDLQRQKDEFLSIASHELRTPLTSIKAFNQLMRRAEDAKTFRSFAERSTVHIQRLEKLITDLLDVSRINSGKMVYTPVLFNFSSLVARMADNMQQVAPVHQLLINSNEEAEFYGDEIRLEQVFTNLIGNAIKYSPDGGHIIIDSRIVQQGIVVSVEDFGVGIAPEHLYKLFDRYYRIDNTAMRFDGLGLGLFISAEIVKRHNGSFWIESEPGKGSTFYFRLPFEAKEKTSPLEDQDTIYADEYITLGCIQDRLELTWHGFQNLRSIKSSCMRILRMVEHNQVKKLLADNTYVAGDWSEASEWVGATFLPLLADAGIRQLAWVVSKSTFNRITERQTVALYEGPIQTQFFPSRVDAMTWLNQNCG